MAPNELQQLNRKRGAIKHKLTHFASFIKPLHEQFLIDSKLPNLSLVELQQRLNKFENLETEFENIQIQIECSCDEDKLSEQYVERDNFATLFSTNLATAKVMLITPTDVGHTEQSGNNCTASSSNPTNDNLQNVKLPTIDLPKFNGHYGQWLEFKDTFESLIHNNTSINNIQKYHYLRASLAGDAIKVIQALEFSADNYNTAWELLCNRFNNYRLLVHNHIKAIFHLEPLLKESAHGLRFIIDSVHKHLRALTTLKQATQHWDTLIIFIIASKLDKTTTREWENFKTSNEFPTLEEMCNFLKSRADLLETLEVSHDIKLSKDSNKRTTVKNLSLLSAVKTCNFCHQSHLIYSCPSFLKLSIPERNNKVNSLKLCENCLCTGHASNKCKSGRCRTCQAKHNSLLHIDQSPVAQTGNHSVFSTQLCNKNILLSTVLLYVIDEAGNKHKCRALLDSGSQSNFIVTSFCKQLNLNECSANVSIIGINNISSSINSKCTVNISSIYEEFSTTISCLVLPIISSNLPFNSFDIASWQLPENIQLADPSFNQSQPVDMLIGASHFWSLLKGEKLELGNGFPILNNTHFGWILSGPTPNYSNKSQCFLSETVDLENSIQRFWEIEDCSDSRLLSNDEQLCEEHFTRTTSRSDEGRFIVRIPFKDSPDLLGESKSIALKRLFNLESKFTKNSEYRSKYVSFMHEYIDLNHMSKVDNPFEENNVSYYIPHHGVFRSDSLTSNLRVVFDGSSISSSGYSLNSIQLTGPSLQNDIVSILLRFRQHQFVVTADIAKMYRQILVHPDDRHLQRILWRDDPVQDVVCYNLNTVSYGTVSAPYLAIRCLKQLALENKLIHSQASDIIYHDFYVDDLISGFDDIDYAIKTCNEISNILESAGFHLRKWCSNCTDILHHFHNHNEPMSTLSFGDYEFNKTLGIRWQSQQDFLMFHISTPTLSSITKRSILSDISTIYDPLGLVSPCVIFAKIIIQELWLLKLDWDHTIPDKLYHKWCNFRRSLTLLNDISIPRHAICTSPIQIQVHGFCDASQNAYGACVYLRSINNTDDITVNLLCSKTRVAPLKSTTIPRLELCSALLLSRLVNRVYASLTCNLDITAYLWSDSQIALCWIRTDTRKLQIFVSNRVSEIQRLTQNCSWNHISGKENPADLASRGVSSETLSTSKLWWNGPSWLSLPQSCWPQNSIEIPPIIPEIKQHALSSTVCDFDLFTKYSSLRTLKNVVAYCFRFVKNCKQFQEKREFGPLTINELDFAMKQLIKIAQQDSFSAEITILSNNAALAAKNKLLGLAPFFDSDNLLRVGGRLKNANLSYDNKHPLLLSGKHKLTRLIFESEHKRLLHAGPQLLLSSVRQTYWPTSGMNVAKGVVKSCLTCYKQNAKSVSPLMADLPERRVNVHAPFQNSGVDYAGPYLIKDRSGRGCKLLKAYICLFICLATKAIHLELVTSLSSESFILALRRFSARRGKPVNIYSDNATNFVGAKNELKYLHDFFSKNKDAWLKSCIDEGISWHFIPPNSPHFGGIWEAGIKSTKFHLSRVLGETKLTYEEFYSVLAQIEATLNSRPLYPLSSDPNDLSPLTPAHFLIGKPLISVPDPNLTDVPCNRLSRFQFMQKLNQDFWKRWSTDYLHHLQQRNKWKRTTDNIPIGSLVLIKQDNLPPCNWLLGRIENLHPGHDGVVRVVSVRTAKGTIKRALTKVCPLPIQIQIDDVK